MLVVGAILPAHDKGQAGAANVSIQSIDEQEAFEAEPSVTIIENRSGRIAEASVGVVGQRQTRSQTAIGNRSTARVSGRLQTRVQNRLRNRIDRYYNPQANATDPFAVAEAESMSAGNSP